MSIINASRASKAVLNGSTCNADFPRNTVSCFRDMLHDFIRFYTGIDFPRFSVARKIVVAS